MFFSVLPHGYRGQAPVDARLKAFLHVDNWDDWFTYNTAYSLVVCDNEGKQVLVGGVKIGQFGMLEHCQTFS